MSLTLTAPTQMDAAIALGPLIAAHADQAEAERRLPEVLVDAFRDARLFQMLIPRDVGGDDMALADHLRVLEALATVDGSAAWNVMIGSSFGTFAAWLDPATADEVYGNGRSVWAGAFAVNGYATRVEGGFRLTGRWPYCSGSQQSDWLHAGFAIRNGDELERTADGRVVALTAVIPRAEWTIEDTWHTTGMRGTGSHHTTVNDVFVPTRRTYDFVGAPMRRDSPMRRLSPFSLNGPGISAVCLGIARHAISAFVELAGTKRHILSKELWAERSVAQVCVSKAEATLRSARAFFYEAIGDIWNAAEEGREATLEERCALRLACVNAAQASADVVDMVFRASGSSAVQTSVPLERCWRDVNTAATHLVVNESNYETTGMVLFGLDHGAGLI